jgi:hypothetical protein
MKNLKNSKLMLVLLSVGIVSGIGLSVWFTIGSPLDKSKDSAKVSVQSAEEKDKKVEEASGLSSNEVDKLTDKQKDEYLNGQGQLYADKKYKVYNKNNKEYPEDQGKLLVKQYMDLASVASYDKIIDDMKTKTDKYNFTTGDNLVVAGIYHDATIMLSTLTVPQVQSGKIAKGMQDPNMMTIGTMMLPELSRRSVILDKSSLTPLFSGAVKIVSTEALDGTTKDSKAQVVFNSCVGSMMVYKVTFEVENNPLIAYIAEYDNASLDFYGVYAPEGKEYYYQTISFFEEQDKNTQKHLDLESQSNTTSTTKDTTK